jgi:hypothetical protein
MRNTEMAKLGALVGEWSMTMSDASFLQPPGTTVPGTTRFSLWRNATAESGSPTVYLSTSQDVVMTKSPDRISVEALITASKLARHAISATCAKPGTSPRR